MIQKVDDAQTLREFSRLKSFVKVKPDLRKLRCIQDLAIQLNQNEDTRSDFPNLLIILDWVLAIPLSNAEAERDFSKLKIVKNRLRNRLEARNLNNLLTISINGPPIDDFDFEKCAVSFKGSKKRKMFEK